MKTLLTLLAAAGLLAGAALAQSASPPARQLRVLELKGSAYERGFQHGQQLRPEIARIIMRWKEDLRAYAKQDADELIRRFLAETNFLPAIRRWTPELLEEIRGIAEGSGQRFETVFAFQLLDELWVFMDIPAANHCSSLGVAKSGGHPAYVAQNMDLESFRDGFQIVLHLTGGTTEPEQLVFSSAGMIGLNGVNGRSIAIACNTLMELTASTDGLPVACIVRGVLAQTDGESALEFVRDVRHASGQNYILGVGDRVFDFEASAGKVVRFQPLADGNVVFHANHALVNDDLKPWHEAVLQAESRETRESGNSPVRFSALHRRLTRPAGEIDEGVICEVLRSKDSAQHPVCRAIEPDADIFTFGATIMTLSGTPAFAVTAGPPDVNPFTRLQFTAGEKP